MSTTFRRADAFRRGSWVAALLLLLCGSASSAPASDLSGRYAVLREKDRDTGCMLTLRAGSKVQLAPACRDNGVVIFDPVGWALDRGRLVLTARKGHKAHFDKGADGVWRRDETEGKALGLKLL